MVDDFAVIMGDEVAGGLCAEPKSCYTYLQVRDDGEVCVPSDRDSNVMDTLLSNLVSDNGIGDDASLMGQQLQLEGQIGALNNLIARISDCQKQPILPTNKHSPANLLSAKGDETSPDDGKRQRRPNPRFMDSGGGAAAAAAAAADGKPTKQPSTLIPNSTYLVGVRELQNGDLTGDGEELMEDEEDSDSEDDEDVLIQTDALSSHGFDAFGSSFGAEMINSPHGAYFIDAFPQNKVPKVNGSHHKKPGFNGHSRHGVPRPHGAGNGASAAYVGNGNGTAKAAPAAMRPGKRQLKPNPKFLDDGNGSPVEGGLNCREMPAGKHMAAAGKVAAGTPNGVKKAKLYQNGAKGLGSSAGKGGGDPGHRGGKRTRDDGMRGFPMQPLSPGMLHSPVDEEGHAEHMRAGSHKKAKVPPMLLTPETPKGMNNGYSDSDTTPARKSSTKKSMQGSVEKRSKHHNPWSLEEAEALVEGVALCGGGKWADIKKLSFAAIESRSAVDLKDKWRNLLRIAMLPSPPTPKAGDKKREIPASLLDRVRELAASTTKPKPSPDERPRSRMRVDESALHDGDDLSA